MKEATEKPGSPDATGGGESRRSFPRPPVPHLITGQKPGPAKVEFARKLRCEMTPEERLLWNRDRANRLHGLHFRRQQFVHGFIADFYCHAAGVVVEVDGPFHDDQIEYDAARNSAFTATGLLVLRFRNDEVTGAMPEVLERIAAASAAQIVASCAALRATPSPTE